jgi:hypothetical protein
MHGRELEYFPAESKETCKSGSLALLALTPFPPQVLCMRSKCFIVGLVEPRKEKAVFIKGAVNVKVNP